MSKHRITFARAMNLDMTLENSSSGISKKTHSLSPYKFDLIITDNVYKFQQINTTSSVIQLLKIFV